MPIRHHNIFQDFGIAAVFLTMEIQNTLSLPINEFVILTWGIHGNYGWCIRSRTYYDNGNDALEIRNQNYSFREIENNVISSILPPEIAVSGKTDNILRYCSSKLQRITDLYNQERTTHQNLNIEIIENNINQIILNEYANEVLNLEKFLRGIIHTRNPYGAVFVSAVLFESWFLEKYNIPNSGYVVLSWTSGIRDSNCIRPIEYFRTHSRRYEFRHIAETEIVKAIISSIENPIVSVTSANHHNLWITRLNELNRNI